MAVNYNPRWGWCVRQHIRFFKRVIRVQDKTARAEWVCRAEWACLNRWHRLHQSMVYATRVALQQLCYSALLLSVKEPGVEKELFFVANCSKKWNKKETKKKIGKLYINRQGKRPPKGPTTHHVFNRAKHFQTRPRPSRNCSMTRNYGGYRKTSGSHRWVRSFPTVEILTKHTHTIHHHRHKHVIHGPFSLGRYISNTLIGHWWMFSYKRYISKTWKTPTLGLYLTFFDSSSCIPLQVVIRLLHRNQELSQPGESQPVLSLSQRTSSREIMRDWVPRLSTPLPKTQEYN